jgi:hypothetical protein
VAELAAPGSLQQPPDALERTQSVFGGGGVPSSVSEAERFAAAVEDMPAKVRAFFEREDPVQRVSWESVAERAEWELRQEIGGWCGD